jgi:RimJ/RimL family protein N-acetyltransferase
MADIIPFIKGNRIDLIPPTLELLDFFSMTSNLAHIRRYARQVFPSPHYTMEKWIKFMIESDNHILLPIFQKEEGKVIGYITIEDIQWRDRTGYLGIGINDDKYWNQGYGTEAGTLAVNYAFRELNLHKFMANFIEPNVGSRRILEKIGFQFEGEFIDHVYVEGKYYNLMNYALFQQEWLK